MRHAIDLGLQQAMLDRVRAAYGRRLEAMESALAAGLEGLARWRTPAGGYFFWLELDPSVDAAALKPRALAQGVGFQPGPVFSAEGKFKHFIRLSFAHYRREQIREGIGRLSGLLRKG